MDKRGNRRRAEEENVHEICSREHVRLKFNVTRVEPQYTYEKEKR